MASTLKRYIPQVGNPTKEVNPTTGSDRVKASVAGAGADSRDAKMCSQIDIEDLGGALLEVRENQVETGPQTPLSNARLLGAGAGKPASDLAKDILTSVGVAEENKALNLLQEKLKGLVNFVLGKKNIHKEPKEMARASERAFVQYLKAKSVRDRDRAGSATASMCRACQTSPIVRPGPANLGMRGRSPPLRCGQEGHKVVACTARKRGAAMELVREEGADIVIISEEYRDLQTPNWVREASGRAAIWICGNLHISGRMSTALPGFAWVEVASMRSLDAIVASARLSRLPVVIGGHFNAWATECGSAKTNLRGRVLLESFTALKLEIANQGTTPTFIKDGKLSIVDLTFVHPRLIGAGLGWKVRDRYTGSDHQAIVYQLHTSGRTRGKATRWKDRRWATATFDQETFICSQERTIVEGTPEGRAQALTKALAKACDASMSARRLHQSARNGPRYKDLTAAYENKRKELKTAIKKVKRRGQVPPSCPLLLDSIVLHLFPAHELRAVGTGLRLMAEDDTEEPPEVSESELRMAA
ncbi:hypothetical protein KM043_000094 [Ampulex compressa]|nr:hypothetical protein KM043_000094 [Ampulex compressa]